MTESNIFLLSLSIKILEQLSPKPLEIARSFALMHSDKNRNNDFLPRKINKSVLQKGIFFLSK